MLNRKQIVAMILALLVVPVQFTFAAVVDIPRVYAPETAVALTFTNPTPEASVTENEPTDEVVYQASKPTRVYVSAEAQPIELVETADITGSLVESEVAVSIEPAEEVSAGIEEQQAPPQEAEEVRKAREQAEAAAKAVQTATEQSRIAQETLRAAEATAQEQRTQQQIEQNKQKVEKQTEQEIQRKLEQMPTLFGKLPEGETVEHEMDGLVFETSTKYGKFEILPPKDGEAKYPHSIISQSIRKVIATNQGESFAREFKAAATRLEQEQILLKYDPSLADYRAPEKFFDTESFSCADPGANPPANFPKAEASKSNPDGYHVIKHFGSNKQTRMAKEVNDLASFAAALPKAIEGIDKRLATCESDSRVRAELADFLFHLGQTGQMDPKVAHEDWTKNYPFHSCSMGSGQPLTNVWFQPDEVGAKERGILWVSHISGEAFWINFRCGLNIDKIAGCSKPVYVGTFKVQVTEGNLICKDLTVEGKTPVGTDASNNRLYSLTPGETVTATAVPMATYKDVRLKSPGWKWDFNGQDFDHVDQGTVTVSEQMLTTPTATLSVSSTLPKDLQTGPNDRKYCTVAFAHNPQALCESLGEMSIQKDRVYVPFRFVDDSHIVKQVQYLLDGRPIPDSQIRQEQVGISFPATLIADYQEHFVNVRLLGADGVVLAECSGRGANNRIVLPRPCDCGSVNGGPSKLDRKVTDQAITLKPVLTGDRSTIVSAVWTGWDGKVVDSKYVDSQLNLSFQASQLLPTVSHKGAQQLKPGSYGFKLTVTNKDGKTTICSYTLKVQGGGKIWPWLLLAAVVIAVVVIIVVTHGAAAAAATKIPIPVVGV